jgi:hypothetical protein
MNMDHNNLLVLSTVFENQSKMWIRNWYRRYFKPGTSFRNGGICLLANQRGGAPILTEMVVDGKPFMINIDHLIGETVFIDKKRVDVIDIYFLSLAGKGRSTYCVWLTTDPAERTGHINGVGKRYKCLGVKRGDQQPVEIYGGQKQGEILMKALLQYCYEHLSEMRINRLELGDMAEWECQANNEMILIGNSNMLLGRDPYYMKFGFVPVYTSAMRKIEYNRELADRLVTNSKAIKTLLEGLAGERLNPFINDLVEKYEKRPLKSLLSEIAEHDCVLYAKCYQKLFDHFKFRPLEKPEITYEYIFELDQSPS